MVVQNIPNLRGVETYNIFLYDLRSINHLNPQVRIALLKGYKRSFCVRDNNRGTVNHPSLDLAIIPSKNKIFSNSENTFGFLLKDQNQEQITNISQEIDPENRNIYRWQEVEVIISGKLPIRAYSPVLVNPNNEDSILNPALPIEEKAQYIINAQRAHPANDPLGFTINRSKQVLKMIGKDQELQDMITILERTPAEEERRTRVSATHNKNKRGSEYLYVWWLFDKEEDYNTIKNHQIYPRDNGTLRVNYKEPGSKELDEALKGTKRPGKVLGQLLGYRDLTNRNIEFMNIVDPAPVFNEDHVIALGVAKLNLYDFATKELRMGDWFHGRKDPTQHGLIKGIWEYIKEGKMRFDPSNLKWHWAKWDGALPGVEEKGVIRGRIVIRDENRQIPELELGIPLQNAEAAATVYNHTGDIGLAHHVEAQVNGHTIAPAVQADEHGRFEIEIPRRNFGQQIILVSGPEDHHRRGTHQQGWPARDPIILTVDHREFEHAIIPKAQSAGSRGNRLIIRPHPTIVNNHESLQAPFGGQFVEIERNRENDQVRFDTNSNSGTQRNLRVFLYDVYNDAILTNNSLGQLGLTVQINIQGANNQTYVYNDDNAHPFRTNCNVTFRIQRDNNLLHNIPRFLMAVVAIQQGNEANERVDRAIVEHMRYENVNHEGYLREQGVFDCNYSLILLR